MPLSTPDGENLQLRGWRSVAKRILLQAAWVMAAVGWAGCTALETNQAACLQEAMDGNHRAAIGILKRANQEMRPYRIDQGVAGSSFSKADLSLLSPADVAAWDRILGGLDAYCAALAGLTDGKSAADFTTASESFGLKIQSLANSVKGSSAPAIVDAGTAVTELGRVLIRYKAGREAQGVARAADPSFQSVVGGLLQALGYAGHPPAPAAHGLLGAYEVSFQTVNAEKSLKRFKGDAIAGFDAMTPAERRAAIKDFIAWLDAEQEHEDFVGSVSALAAALDKAAAAHAALARGSKEAIGAAFAELRAEIQSTVQIYQKYKGG